jgi:hypothetical protein
VVEQTKASSEKAKQLLIGANIDEMNVVYSARSLKWAPIKLPSVPMKTPKTKPTPMFWIKAPIATPMPSPTGNRNANRFSGLFDFDAITHLHE